MVCTVSDWEAIQFGLCGLRPRDRRVDGGVPVPRHRKWYGLREVCFGLKVVRATGMWNIRGRHDWVALRRWIFSGVEVSVTSTPNLVQSCAWQDRLPCSQVVSEPPQPPQPQPQLRPPRPPQPRPPRPPHSVAILAQVQCTLGLGYRAPVWCKRFTFFCVRQCLGGNDFHEIRWRSSCWCLQSRPKVGSAQLLASDSVDLGSFSLDRVRTR